MGKRRRSAVVVPLQRKGWFDVPRTVLDDVPAIKPSGYYVYSVLASHKNRRGLAWPSLHRIMALTGYNRRTVQRALDKLAARMHIEIVRVGVGRQSTVYRLPGGVEVAEREAVWKPPLRRSGNRPNENLLNEKKIRIRSLINTIAPGSGAGERRHEAEESEDRERQTREEAQRQKLREQARQLGIGR